MSPTKKLNALYLFPLLARNYKPSRRVHAGNKHLAGARRRVRALERGHAFSEVTQQ